MTKKDSLYPMHSGHLASAALINTCQAHILSTVHWSYRVTRLCTHVRIFSTLVHKYMYAHAFTHAHTHLHEQKLIICPPVGIMHRHVLLSDPCSSAFASVEHVVCQS